MVLFALISDIKSSKIKNSINFPFMLLGFVVNFSIGGREGLINSFIGVIIPFLLLIVFFALRMLGAGDIKLFCAIGAILGPTGLGYIMICSFLAGGAIAIILIIKNRIFKERVRYFFNYLKFTIKSFCLTPYTYFGNKQDFAKFRFSYAVVLGTIISLIIK